MEILVKKESKDADTVCKARLGLQYLKEVGVRKGLTEKAVLDAGEGAKRRAFTGECY